MRLRRRSPHVSLMAQSRRRCGGAVPAQMWRRSPGADVAAQMWRRRCDGAVPAQMWWHTGSAEGTGPVGRRRRQHDWRKGSSSTTSKPPWRSRADSKGAPTDCVPPQHSCTGGISRLVGPEPNRSLARLGRYKSRKKKFFQVMTGPTRCHAAMPGGPRRTTAGAAQHHEDEILARPVAEVKAETIEQQKGCARCREFLRTTPCGMPCRAACLAYRRRRFGLLPFCAPTPGSKPAGATLPALPCAAHLRAATSRRLAAKARPRFGCTPRGPFARPVAGPGLSSATKSRRRRRLWRP